VDNELGGSRIQGKRVDLGFEEIGRGRLTNDVLIAVSTVRAKATLCTANAKGFQRIREFLNFSFVIV